MKRRIRYLIDKRLVVFIGATIPEETAKQLAHEAIDKDTTISALVEKAVDRYLSRK